MVGWREGGNDGDERKEGKRKREILSERENKRERISLNLILVFYLSRSPFHSVNISVYLTIHL